MADYITLADLNNLANKKGINPTELRIFTTKDDGKFFKESAEIGKQAFIDEDNDIRIVIKNNIDILRNMEYSQAIKIVEAFLDEYNNASCPTMEFFDGETLVISQSNLGRQEVLSNLKRDDKYLDKNGFIDIEVADKYDIEQTIWNITNDIGATVLSYALNYAYENEIDILNDD